ncbi:MAG: sigma 54-interacting transcriptional regulator [Treponema sp.]|jgi:Nif-specific regulatory protein|nr:sigma 54-interacting transcriptional regulator [Treponema sp.]
MSDSYHKLIAKSSCILELLRTVDRVAKTDSSVLILGESGVGKELFAEQVHLRSLRKNGPFIRVNCAAIPEGLLESELFGHVKGAFTDAAKDRQGRFNMAENGTIFLDEIADLPPILQVKILRVIQEKKLEKVGSDITVNLNVRIIAATNKDLEHQVQLGLFREDLYYRLNVLPLYIPPLKQRKDDIMELAGYFLEKYAGSDKKQNKPTGFSMDAEQALLSYSWPGNVRELQNCIERACVIGKNKVIGREDLFLKPDILNDIGVKDKSLKTAITDFKANFIRKVLEENNWNQTETAKVLVIQRTYLSKLIKELKLSPKELYNEKK